MSSQDIAELTGKRHDHVMRVRAMLDGLEIAAPSFGGYYRGDNGKQSPCFHLPKRECLILVSGYSVVLRAKIIDRWAELERILAATQAARRLVGPRGAGRPRLEQSEVYARKQLITLAFSRKVDFGATTRK